ncbi:phosphoribosylanthranilate isomerase [Candidatus Enterococcus ferrettii]|uniref:N-(5'-phosphoribosyl)anthranilate isomerase n=1 Tax=Candidatus Enterococcus ferrettii TaxID=2815324 RepID=A0ABV0ETU2_9ENTE|nr:phosphoribosylanthranilate isomerase [Enterococcus sp. 665A]MBO1342208.1 phosphoribosylanthranilate isomerase [Enterococcus sp. 665A]
MTQIKICGLSTRKAVETAVNSGADYLGFVFAKSPRQVTPAQVHEITLDLPTSIKKVGVFVSPSQTEVEATIQAAGLDLVQIHGEQLSEVLSVPIIRAVSIRKSYPLFESESEDYLLLDAPPTKYMGGNGEVFDWQAVNPAELQQERLFIAGGLTPENVAAAIHYFQPLVVDVSSGVETDGEKDHKKITAFCQAVKEETDVSATNE